MGDRSAAYKLRNRMHSLGWWAKIAQEHPLGVIPLRTVPRVLGISRQRAENLAKEGRLRVIVMPGGTREDRFVPVADLYTAPTELERGRPLVQRIDTRQVMRDVGNPDIPVKPLWGDKEISARCPKCQVSRRIRNPRIIKDLGE